MDIWGSVFARIVLVFSARHFLFARTQKIGDLRLADGSEPNEGRVEFYLGFRGWYSTCDAHWSIDDAMVVCRQLGFPGAAIARTTNPYGAGAGVPLARDWECRGDERRLQDCTFTPRQRCLETVGVVCQAPGYIGCFSDPSGSFNSRLRDDFVSLASMSVTACRDHCLASGSLLAGLKNGRECHCGRFYGEVEPDRRQSDGECQMPCAGNPDEICGGAKSQLRAAGGPDRLSVFDLKLGRCDPPAQPTNGRLLGDEYSYGDVIRFKCAKGHRLANASAGSIRCVMVRDGTGKTVGWDAPTPSCQVAVDSNTRMTLGDQFARYETIERQYIFLSVLACLVVVLTSAILFILVKRRMGRRRTLTGSSSSSSSSVRPDPPPCYEDLVRDYERIADPKTGHFPIDRSNGYQTLNPPVPNRPPKYAVRINVPSRINVPGHISYPKELWDH